MTVCAGTVPEMCQSCSSMQSTVDNHVKIQSIQIFTYFRKFHVTKNETITRHQLEMKQDTYESVTVKSMANLVTDISGSQRLNSS